MVVYAFNPSIWDADAGRYLGVSGQPGIHSETLSHIEKEERYKRRHSSCFVMRIALHGILVWILITNLLYDDLMSLC